MRIAVVSDLHANLYAIESVIEDARQHGASHLICLGDIVGYGPQPLETLNLVRNMAAACVLGNHDAAVCGMIPLEPFNAFAIRTLQRAQLVLSSDQKAWLAARPYILESEHFACAHSGFADPERFHYLESKQDARINFNAQKDHQLLFVGHTHLPGIYVENVATKDIRLLPPHEFRLQTHERYIVNPGAVGFPRTDDVDPTYVLYDTNTRFLSFRKVQYNFASFRIAIVNNGYNLLDYWFLAPNACQKRTVRAFLQPTHISTARLSKDFKPKNENTITPVQKLLWLLGALLAASLILIVLLAMRLRQQNETFPIRVAAALREAEFTASTANSAPAAPKPDRVSGPNAFPLLTAWTFSEGVSAQRDDTFRIAAGKNTIASPTLSLPQGLTRMTISYTFDCERAAIQNYSSKLILTLKDGSTKTVARHRYEVPQPREDTIALPEGVTACRFVFSCDISKPASLEALSLAYQ